MKSEWRERWGGGGRGGRKDAVEVTTRGMRDRGEVGRKREKS